MHLVSPGNSMLATLTAAICAHMHANFRLPWSLNSYFEELTLHLTSNSMLPNTVPVSHVARAAAAMGEGALRAYDMRH